MIQKYSKKLIAILLIMAMVMSMMPAMTITVNAAATWSSATLSTAPDAGDNFLTIAYGNNGFLAIADTSGDVYKTH